MDNIVHKIGPILSLGGGAVDHVFQGKKLTGGCGDICFVFGGESRHLATIIFG